MIICDIIWFRKNSLVTTCSSSKNQGKCSFTERSEPSANEDKIGIFQSTISRCYIICTIYEIYVGTWQPGSGCVRLGSSTPVVNAVRRRSTTHQCHGHFVPVLIVHGGPDSRHLGAPTDLMAVAGDSGLQKRRSCERQGGGHVTTGSDHTTPAGPLAPRGRDWGLMAVTRGLLVLGSLKEG
jgi:hypothetical protein